MRNYLFDTNVFSLLFLDKIPEKWSRYWKEIREGSKKLIIFEMLISEILYKNSKKLGLEKTKDKILEIKSLRNSVIIPVDDNDAFSSGGYMLKLNKFGLSHVDSYILTLSKRCNARIVTTDPGLKNAGKNIGVEVDYLPLTV